MLVESTTIFFHRNLRLVHSTTHRQNPFNTKCQGIKNCGVLYMIYYGYVGDAVRVYGNVNNIKVLRRKQVQYFIQLFLMLMQSSLLLNADSTTTLFSLRTRQLKAEPLNNMLRNVFWSPGSSKWDAFFHSTTLFVVTMNCPSQVMILLKTEHKFLNLQLVKCIIVMYCVNSRDYASQLRITGLKCWVEHMAAFEPVIYLFPGSLPLLVHFIWRRRNRGTQRRFPPKCIENTF